MNGTTARLRIEHSGDGTLLHGTERGDSALTALRAAGRKVPS